MKRVPWSGVLLAMAVLAGGAMTPGMSAACSCGQETCEQLINRSKLIVAGHVTSIREEQGEWSVHNVATFTVWYGWKGEFTASLDVRTAQSDAMCGYPFVVGYDYLVLTDQADPDGTPWVELCSGTIDLVAADPFLQILGPAPIVPVRPATWSAIKALYQ